MTDATVEMLDDEGVVQEECVATRVDGEAVCEDCGATSEVYSWVTLADMKYVLCVSCLDLDDYTNLKESR